MFTIEKAQVFHADDAPTPSCHASTIVDCRGGLLAAWFGGSHEKCPDVDIWIARQVDGNWSQPQRVADGDGVACWNPVLSRLGDGTILLFYKVGPQIRDWKTWLVTSADNGASWSTPRSLGTGLAGPVKNKPCTLADGTLLCGTSDEPDWREWQVYFSLSRDRAQSWEIVGPIAGIENFHAIQPTLLVHGDDLQALVRTREGVIAETWSRDGGRSWTALQATPLPNPNSGIDAVTLADGRHLLVYNDTTEGRSPLNMALSGDGRHWENIAELAPDDGGEYSYPAVIQADDGQVHVTWTDRRRTIAHAWFDPRHV